IEGGVAAFGSQRHQRVEVFVLGPEQNGASVHALAAGGVEGGSQSSTRAPHAARFALRGVVGARAAFTGGRATEGAAYTGGHSTSPPTVPKAACCRARLRSRGTFRRSSRARFLMPRRATRDAALCRD